ncbi:MAG: hypothetical protein WCJ49_05420 [Deltaproteobacteria bacterium]|jgi:hypothetical protein
MGKMFLIATCMMLAFSQICGCDSISKEKAGNAGAKMIEPAMIITKEDAKALTGVSFGECTVKEEPRVGLKLCVYEKDGAFFQVGLTQMAFMDKKSREGGNTPQSIFKATKSVIQDASRIDGVGDDNFLMPPGLHILKGQYYMTVSLGLMAKDKEKLQAAGMKAVENLSKYSAQ